MPVVGLYVLHGLGTYIGLLTYTLLCECSPPYRQVNCTMGFIQDKLNVLFSLTTARTEHGVIQSTGQSISATQDEVTKHGQNNSQKDSQAVQGVSPNTSVQNVSPNTSPKTSTEVKPAPYSVDDVPERFQECKHCRTVAGVSSAMLTGWLLHRSYVYENPVLKKGAVLRIRIGFIILSSAIASIGVQRLFDIGIFHPSNAGKSFSELLGSDFVQIKETVVNRIKAINKYANDESVSLRKSVDVELERSMEAIRQKKLKEESTKDKGG